MKPRNFISTILLLILFLSLIIFVPFAKKIDWKVIFIGIAGIIVLIPDLFLRPKHKAGYLVYKSLAQVGLIAIMFFSVVLGFVFALGFGLSEGFAQGCGGNITHTPFDKFVANYMMYMFIPIIFKLVMNIVDFALYRKELKKLKQQIDIITA